MDKTGRYFANKPKCDSHRFYCQSRSVAQRIGVPRETIIDLGYDTFPEDSNPLPNTKPKSFWMEEREELEALLSDLRELSLIAWTEGKVRKELMAYAAAGWPFGLRTKDFLLWVKFDQRTRLN